MLNDTYKSNSTNVMCDAIESVKHIVMKIDVSAELTKRKNLYDFQAAVLNVGLADCQTSNMSLLVSAYHIASIHGYYNNLCGVPHISANTHTTMATVGT